jgi:hypothetical protein
VGSGFEVAGQAGDADELLRKVGAQARYPAVPQPFVRGGRAAGERSSHGDRQRVACDRVALQELRDRLSDGFGTLDLQEVAGLVDRALLDVRE